MRAPRWLWRLLAAGVALLGVAPGAPAQSFLGRGAEDWARDLKDKKPAVRRGAAFALGKLGGGTAATADRLVELLEKDADAVVREAAAFALGEVGPTGSARAVPALRKVLVSRKEEPAVRRSAAFALGCYGGQADSALPELLSALGDGEPMVRQNAAWALGRLKHKAGEDEVRALCDRLADTDPSVRRAAAAALGDIGKDEGGRKASRPAVAALLQCCRAESDDEVRRTALGALVNVVGPEDQGTDRARGLQELLRRLQEQGADKEEVREAALALGNIGGPEARGAVKVLGDLLADVNDLEGRRLAALALASVGKDAADALAYLMAALRDTDAEVRRSAALALGHLGERAEDAVPELVKLLEPPDPSEDVQRYALEALASVGPKAARDALPTLRAVLESDRAWRLRQRAVWVMQNLSPDEVRAVVPYLERALQETKHEPRLVRYETALLLVSKFGPDVSERTRAVLLENLNDPDLKIYEGTGAAVSGSAPESKSGSGTVTEKLTGDARYLPARALERIGRKAGEGELGRKIIESLRKAAEAKDEKVRGAARDALKAITGE